MKETISRREAEAAEKARFVGFEAETVEQCLFSGRVYHFSVAILGLWIADDIDARPPSSHR